MKNNIRPFFFFALFIIIFYRFWNHNIIFRDSFIYFGPNKYLIAQALKKITIYAWYPWHFLGQPFVADVSSGWFYPLNLIYLIFPFEPAHRIFILIHYPLSAIFMDVFLRGRGLGKSASLAGALVFPLSGYMISQHGNVIYLIALCWAPLALHFAGRAFSELSGRAIGHIAACAACLAMQVLGGDPQAGLITALIIFLMAARDFFSPTRRSSSLLAVLMIGIFSIALTAIQTLPTIEALRYSARARGLPLEEAAAFSIHSGRLIELLWPTSLVSVYPEYNYWGDVLLDQTYKRMPWSITDYLGLPVLLLCAIGLITSMRHSGKFLLIGMIASLTLAFGIHTPLFGFLYDHVPLFDIFRFPAKYMGWFTFFTVVAAAVGFETIAVRLKKNPLALNRWCFIYLAGVISAAVVVWWTRPAVLSGIFKLTPSSADYRFATDKISLGAIQWILVNAAIASLPIVISRKWLTNKQAMTIFLFILTLDFFLINVAGMPAGPRGIYKDEPRAAAVISHGKRPAAGFFRIFRETMTFAPEARERRSLSEYEQMQLFWHNTLNVNHDAMSGFENIGGNNQGMLLDLAIDDLLAQDPKLTCRLFNVEYLIASLSPGITGDAEHQTIFSDAESNFTVAHLDHAFPRAYLVYSAKRSIYDETAQSMLSSVDLTRSVIITSQENIDEASTSDAVMKPSRIISDVPDEVVIECDARASGWLVLSDRFFPGWKAFIDGVPTTIYKANLLVRAVKMPSGKHTVRFAYQPLSLRAGAIISIPAWILAFGLWVHGIRKK